MIILLLIGAGGGLAISAVVLSGACRLVRVEPPEFLPAMGICLLVSIITFAVPTALAVAMTLLTGGFTAVEQLDAARLGVLSAPFATCLTPFLTAATYCFILEQCSFVRGLFLWFAQLIVIAEFALLFFGIGTTMNLFGP